MKITAYNKNIEITDKNARAFKKMHHNDIDSVDVEIYIDAYYHRIPNEATETELTKIVNDGIQQEAIDCYGIDFYKEA